MKRPSRRMVTYSFEEESRSFIQGENECLSEFHARQSELKSIYNEFICAKDKNRIIELQEIAVFLLDFYYTYSGAVFNNIDDDHFLEMLRFFGKYYSFQTQENVEAIEALPDSFTVFRGGSGSKELVEKGISWTRSKERAEGFSRGPDPILLKTTIQRECVLSANGVLDEVLVDPTLLNSESVSVVNAI